MRVMVLGRDCLARESFILIPENVPSLGGFIALLMSQTEVPLELIYKLGLSDGVLAIDKDVPPEIIVHILQAKVHVIKECIHLRVRDLRQGKQVSLH